jgi:hypothetical protein
LFYFCYSKHSRENHKNIMLLKISWVLPYFCISCTLKQSDEGISAFAPWACTWTPGGLYSVSNLFLITMQHCYS